MTSFNTITGQTTEIS